MKTNIFTKILIILMLQFAIISGMWAVDIGASTLIAQSCTSEVTYQVQGLLFTRDANTQYHLGLGIIYSAFFILSCLYLYTIISKK